MLLSELNDSKLTVNDTIVNDCQLTLRCWLMVDSRWKGKCYSNEPKILDSQVWANGVLEKSEVLKEQSDQGLHYLPFPLHLSDALLNGRKHIV